MNRAPILSLWNPERRGSAVGVEAHHLALIPSFYRLLTSACDGPATVLATQETKRNKID